MMNLFISILLILFLIFTTGCGSKKTERKVTPKQDAANVKTAKAEEKKDTTLKPEEGYTYDPRGRRDPFKSLLVYEKERIKTGAMVPPLQQVDSADLKLVGVVWGQKGHMAMIVTPDGKGFVVKEGMMVGLNKGIIKKITQRSLTIEENIKTLLGELKTREVVLELRKREGGQ